jgi:transposase
MDISKKEGGSAATRPISWQWSTPRAFVECVGETFYGIDLLGPTRDDSHWQARAGKGFAAKDFVIDWEQQRAPCPTSAKRASVGPLTLIGMEPKRSRSSFPPQTAATVLVSKTVQAAKRAYPRRLISIRPQEQYHALRQARQRATTRNYKQEYAHRAGIEGTISQAVRTCEVRRSRYRGLPKTHLHHVLTATALNLLRIGMWLADEPLAQTRHARFVRLYHSAA